MTQIRDPESIDSRPSVALVNNSQTPYRQALHTRIVREIPMVKFYSVYTHEQSNTEWMFSASDEISPVHFGKGERGGASSGGHVRSMIAEWRKGGRILRWIKEMQVRAVVLGGYNDLCRLRIIRSCREMGVPCFLFGDSNIRGDCVTGIRGMVKRALLPKMIRACTGVMPCGELGCQYFLKYGADPDRVFMFPYEPDYDMIQSIDSRILDEVRERFGLDARRRRVIYSGRLVAVKRVDLLIDAFARIARTRPEWDLVLVGDGPLNRTLQSRVPRELLHRVKWLGFLDDQMALSGIYRSSDILVLPSDYEPWGVVVNEAVASGMALLASDQVGAAHELLLEGTNGFGFPAGNLAALVNGLTKAMEPSRLLELKLGSEVALRKWRERADPIAGLKKALRLAGCIASGD